MPKRNIVLILLLSFSAFLMAQTSTFIHVDQFGYHLTAEKVAVLSDPQLGYNAALSYNPPATLQLRNASTHAVVFSGAISQWNFGNTHSRSGDRGWWFDFSSVTAQGSYYVHDPVNNQSSAVFEISDYPYGNVLKAAGRAFYYNRCNAPKLLEHAGAKWTDNTNFLNPLQDANCRYIHDKYNASLEKDLSGGWFDAGDYNKYVTFTYTTLHDLLYAFEESSTVFGDDWNIPESGNGIPDLIDEIKWELDWLIKMNNPDGSVHIKMGSQNYIDNTGAPPSVNTDPRFYGPTCTSASATVASVFAHASIVLGKFPQLASYASNLLAMAESAFAYVLPHFNNNTFETNCDNGEIISGDADRSAQEQIDMMISAAVYLFEKTGNSNYHTFFVNNYLQSKPIVDNFWGPYTIAVQDAMLRYTTLAGANTSVSNDIINKATTQASNNWNGFYGWNNDDLYRAFMPVWSYHWGSNQTKASYGNLNNRLADLGIGNAASFYKKAKELLHYFHGVNPQGMVYLSNMYDYGAERSANEIYHTWFKDGSNWDNALSSLYGPAPGFLTGGPNAQFSVTSIVPPANQPPQKSYKDWNAGWPENSWEITEPAIYYQAAYLRLLARVMHLSRQTVWNGTVDQNWGNPTNWSSGYVPNNHSDIQIAPAAHQPVLDESRTLDNLIIKAGASLTIPPSKALTIMGTIDNQAGNNGLILQSDATGTASLIHGKSGVNATVERFLAGNWSAPDAGWHLISSPVSLLAISTFETTGPGNGFDFYGWNEPANMWMNFKDPGFSGWNGGNHFVPGRGYLISYEQNQNRTFTGELNVSNISVSGLTYSPSHGKGWHLLGNPFASALQWNNGSWLLSNVAGTAKIWHSANKSYSDISANGIIPSAQGFFVQVNNSSNGLTIPASARTHSSQTWYKNTTPRILLSASPADGSSRQESQIRIEPAATAGFDFYHDSRFLEGYAPKFYSMADGEMLSTNALPQIQNGTSIPFGFVKNQHNNFIIRLEESLPGETILLKDLKLNLTHDLTQQPEYLFSAAEGDDPNRFLIVFGTVGVDEKPNNPQTLQAAMHNGQLWVINPIGNSLLSIFDLSGRLLQQSHMHDSGLQQLRINLKGGAYLIRLQNQKQTMSAIIISL